MGVRHVGAEVLVVPQVVIEVVMAVLRTVRVVEEPTGHCKCRKDLRESLIGYTPLL